MPNFQAKTKDDLREELYPPERKHEPDPVRDPLPKVADGTAVNHYYFRDAEATLEEVSAPGFFNFMRDTFRSGNQKGVVHMVTCHLGGIAEGLIEVDLHVISAPLLSGGPVVMAVAEPRRFKPVKLKEEKAA